MHPWSLTLDFTHGEMVEFNYIKGIGAKCLSTVIVDRPGIPESAPRAWLIFVTQNSSEQGFFFYFSIPIAAIPGAIVDTCASVAKSSSAGVITTLVVASVGAALMSGLQSASVGHLVIAETSGTAISTAGDWAAKSCWNPQKVFFGVLARTFTYGSYAVFINSSKFLSLGHVQVSSIMNFKLSKQNILLQ